MKHPMLQSIVVLTVICLIASVLLAAVNSVTAPMIAEAAEAKTQASLKAVLPDATGFTEVALPDDAPATVAGVWKDDGGSGYAVALSTTSSYSSAPMTFTVGIGADGTVLAVEMTNYSETKDFGAYPESYSGIGADGVADMDLYAGVTYSSTAFRDAVADAFAVIETMERGA